MDAYEKELNEKQAAWASKNIGVTGYYLNPL
jgi:hypothetical protein